jgi:hypothetical protein
MNRASFSEACLDLAQAASIDAIEPTSIANCL